MRGYIGKRATMFSTLFVFEGDDTPDDTHDDTHDESHCAERVTMDLESYQNYITHNAKIIKHCLDTRTNDFSDIMFWEGIRGGDLGFDELSSKWADVLGCSVIGALPSVERTGADGYIIYKGAINTPVEVETKVCGIRHGDLAVGKRGALYYSTNLENWNSKAAITSQLAGQFKPMSEGTMKSNKRDTFLISFDRTENKIIDANRIDADTVLKLLESKKENTAITLKLSAFQQHGHRMNTLWEVESFHHWHQRMINQTKAAERFIL